MSLDDDYLRYPLRRYGYDHDFYDWSMLQERSAVRWPGDRPLALWVNVAVQFFPLNQRGVPFKVPNGMTMPYPDLRHFSLREYGNRVGIYRVLKALDSYGVTPTFAINAQVAERMPYLLDRLRERGDEILCHGWNMDHLHYGGQDAAEEAQLVRRSVETLRERTGQAIRGWLSPAKVHSANTPGLLVDNGIDYFADWVNDDMPYAFRAGNGELHVIPLSTEIEDQFILCNNLHSELSYAQQVKDAFDFLLEEARGQGGRLLALNIHPWLMGQPHRIRYLEEVLEYVTSGQAAWNASASEILAASRAGEML